ncbi:hypothetical protein [Nocardioides pacificus]
MDRTRKDRTDGSTGSGGTGSGGTGSGGGRRAHWAVALLVSLTVAAIALLTVLLTGNDADEPEPGAADAPATSAEPTPTTDTTPPAPTSPSAPPVFDLLDDVTPGAPPKVPYLERTRLVRPDGTTTPLPHTYDQFTLLGDRIIATYDDQGDRMLVILDADGRGIGHSPVEANFALDADGDVVAWATPQGVLETLWEDGTHTWGNQGGPVTVAAVTSDGSCGADDTTCRVYVNNGSGLPPQAAGPDGTVDGLVPGSLRLTDVHPDGPVAVQLSSSDTGSCSGVFVDGVSRWETCEHSLLRFSPAGDLLLGTHAYRDGLGLNSLSVLDAESGDVRATYTIRGGFIAQQAWEDDTHVLVVISGPHGWEMLRLGLDGTRELVVGPVEPTRDPTFKVLTLPGNI